VLRRKKILGQDTVRPVGTGMCVKLLVAVAFGRNEGKDVEIK
jgi:hypothetical protein